MLPARRRRRMVPAGPPDRLGGGHRGGALGVLARADGRRRGILRAALRSFIENVVTKELPGSPGTQPLGEAEYDTLTELALTLLPAATAVSWMAALLFNLWLAARITLASGRLQRPWPDLAAITFPPGTPLLLAASTAASFAPGMLGLAAAGFAGSFYLAYVLLGLAVVHYTARTQLAPVRLVGTLRRARPYQHRPVAPDRDPRAHRADDLVAPTHRSAAIRRALHLNSPEWQPKAKRRSQCKSSCCNASASSARWATSSPSRTATRATTCCRRRRPCAPTRRTSPSSVTALAARGQQSRAQEGGRGGGRKLDGKSFVAIRSAGDTGQLYGSVSPATSPTP